MGSKEQAIEIAYKYHDQLIKRVGVFIGGHHEGKNYAEDIVQEVYIKLLKYDDLYEKIIKKDGKLSLGYMFFTIRSVAKNYIKKKSNLNYCFGFWNSSSIENEDDVNKFILPLEREDQTQDEITERALERLEVKMLEVLKDRVDWFDYKLFEKYLFSDKSYKTIAQESGLGDKTIYLSIKKSKLIIAEALHEDYIDFLNGDFDLI